MRNIILDFKNISFAYPQSKKLFDNISMGIEAGHFYLLQGASGAGKTTFLRLANRLEEPSAGEILFNEQPLCGYSPTVLRRSILYFHQIPQLVDGSIRENLLLPFQFKQNRDLTVPDEKRMMDFMERLLLFDVKLESPAMNLSTGQQQRVCFIRGLLLSPEILLLDEPASALDDKSGTVVLEIARELCRTSGLTILMASHRIFEEGDIEPVVITFAEGNILL
ncbi:MAG: ATP-binding cassette domain-containing protein [Deltaproteobacteria bacterium]|nr:ATP-binding cassette domain-containing protein [Deltaproteobacteria bacterium]